MIDLSPDVKQADRQAFAIVFFLAAFAYIDGEFDELERTFLDNYLEKLVDARVLAAGGDPEFVRALYRDEFERVDDEIKEMFEESQVVGETAERYVLARLKLRSLEIFCTFDEANQDALLDTVDELIAADGVVHPAEVAFREEVHALLASEAPTEEAVPYRLTLEVLAEVTPQPGSPDHPLFDRIEHPYQQGTVQDLAARDRSLVYEALAIWTEQKERGFGKLVGKTDLGELTEPFLDNHVDVLPPRPGEDYEILVLGDLHGCYSCLKAGLVQSQWLQKMDAWKADPDANPEPHLVLLGDYLDRGRFGLEGCLRAGLILHTTYPGHVHMLRGNHEYFVERDGKVMSGVMPAETIERWGGILGDDHFRTYMELFEGLPGCFIFERTLMVHGGIPRDATIDSLYQDLTFLNHPKVRFQMMWSDPSSAPTVPSVLQAQNARFAFGRGQFRRFMGLVGANVLIRGHEKIRNGFKVVVDEDDVMLLSLFSAGGRHNADLLPGSSYARVKPKALTLRYRDGKYTAMPWTLQFIPFNEPSLNLLAGS